MDKVSYMKRALDLAYEASLDGEVPVGAVIVYEGQIIAEAGNSTRRDNNPTMHAEMRAISMASQILGNERLTECDLYVTKEPCVMCSGAIVHARIRKVYIGASDKRYGACGTVFSVCGNSLLNHIPEIEFGICEHECSAILKNFFRQKRRS